MKVAKKAHCPGFFVESARQKLAQALSTNVNFREGQRLLAKSGLLDD